MNDLISRSAVLAEARPIDSFGFAHLHYEGIMVVDVDDIKDLPALDVAQIVTNGQDTTYLRVKSLDGLRGRIVIDEESGNRCAMYYEEAEDAVPVVHARWIYSGEVDEDGNCEANCSHCGAGDKHRADLKDAVPYCWNCGARMDGEAEWATK